MLLLPHLRDVQASTEEAEQMTWEMEVKAAAFRGKTFVEEVSDGLRPYPASFTTGMMLPTL